MKYLVVVKGHWRRAVIIDADSPQDAGEMALCEPLSIGYEEISSSRTERDKVVESVVIWDEDD